MILMFLYPVFKMAQGGIVLNNNGYIVIENAAHLVLENPFSNAIQVTGIGGNIVSEEYADVVDWKIGTNIGTYTIPFTTIDNVKIPFVYEVTTAPSGGGEVLFSTYRTANNNTPYPPNTDVLDGCLENNSLYTVDRFWRVEGQNYSQLPSVNLNFGYHDGSTEIGGSNNIIEARLKAERYNMNSGSWEIPTYMYGTANSSTNRVENVVVNSSELYPIWTLVDTNSVLEPEVTSNFFDTTICEGNQLVISLGGADNYQWNTLGIASGVSFTPQDSVRYHIVGVNQNNCSDTITVNINVTPLPVAEFSVLTPIVCQGECAEIENNSFSTLSEELTFMHWFVNNNQVVAETGVNVLCDLDVGNYSLGLVVEDVYGCRDSILLNNQIAVKPNPTAGFSMVPNTILYGEELAIINESSGVVEIVYFLDNETEIYGPDASYTYSLPGSDTIMQVVTDKYGCTDTVYQEILINENEAIYIPNSFTPDGNGRNDVFQPVYTGVNGIDNFEFMIFNRWGELVFKSDDINQGWNGTYKNEAVKQGGYVYKLKYNYKGRVVEKLGHVLVLM